MRLSPCPARRRARALPALATAAVLAAAVLALIVPARPAAAGTPTAIGTVDYRPPVDAPLADLFRPPATPYGPGNRGVDYATPQGTLVRAAAGGVVVFAGQVGGSLHVVVLHDDGIRTTYSFLADIAVHRGDRVAQGQPVGTSGPSLHFGARQGDAYIDPLGLFSYVTAHRRVRLVPDDGRGLPPEAAERGALERLVRSLASQGRATAQSLAWMAANGPAAAADAVRRGVGQLDDPDLVRLAEVLALQPVSVVDPRLATIAEVAGWEQARGGCTSRATPTPGPRPGPRLAVLVGGLGSSSGHANILDLPVAALGYAAADVVQFSYRGGTSEAHAYGPTDTQADLAASAARLRALLADLAASHPGLPIDVFAHSQGGLVALLALAPAVAAVRHLVTLGTPFRGADLAAVVDGVRRLPIAAAARAAVARARPLGLDVDRPTAEQLSPKARLASGRGLPAGVRVTSIGARTDVVVPMGRTWLPGAANASVSVPGRNAHAALPGSAAAFREVALALADMAPTCESMVDAAFDAAATVAIAGPEHAADALAAGP
jgi:murein DD-endopeptidase MepM/ murein hydrolase activator NlpD